MKKKPIYVSDFYIFISNNFPLFCYFLFACLWYTGPLFELCRNSIFLIVTELYHLNQTVLQKQNY